MTINYNNYLKMNLTPTQIVSFFRSENCKKNKDGKVIPFSIEDIAKHFSEETNVINLRMTCQKLMNEGILLPAGNDQSNMIPILSERYIALEVNDTLLNYGSYDFVVEGFLSIREKFKKSILCVEVIDKRDITTNGTGFIISDTHFITAKHCIEGMKNVRIVHEEKLIPKDIFFPKEDNLDFCVINFDGTPFKDYAKLRLANGKILDEVIVMGYPPIPGFDAIQVADLSHIGAIMNVSKGSIVAYEKSYLDSNNYFLINSKVKGGNSGGPVINKYGQVIGILTNVPLSSENKNELDKLGYGICFPTEYLIDFIGKIIKYKGLVNSIKFEPTKIGFKTI